MQNKQTNTRILSEKCNISESEFKSISELSIREVPLDKGTMAEFYRSDMGSLVFDVYLKNGKGYNKPDIQFLIQGPKVQEIIIK